ncbi:MAG: response regulator transcription factor [Bacteroidetes bacterium]|nr:response regulator transcription factor [Bacteroidota bacterium]
MKLLIVDDHSDMRKTLRTIVQAGETSPVDFIECDNGEEAIRLFNIHHPDFVLMDIQLGRMDGFTASEQISKLHPDARIIFVTSHQSPSFRNRAMKLNAIGMVLKDNLTELTALLH